MAESSKTKAQERDKQIPWQGGILLAAYLLVLVVFSFYTIVVLWQGVSSPESATVEPAVESATVESDEGQQVENEGLKYLFWTVTPDGELSLVLLVFAAGVLGGLLHAIRSFYWYIGHKMLYARWVPMYLLVPLASGALALMFYLVIRGGLYPSSTLGDVNSLGFVALGGLVGLFSEQAVLKLKSIAESFFEAGGKGEDDVDEELKAKEERAKGKEKEHLESDQQQDNREADSADATR